MNTVRICDSTIRKLSNGRDNTLSFKEKLEVAKLLDKLCVDVIELDEIRNGKVDTLLVKSVVTAVKNSLIAVPVALGGDPAPTAAALSEAVSFRLQVVAPGSWTTDVWDDVNRMKTFNTSQKLKKRMLHVCPLQIDIVDRLINRYSNPGDVVLDPFGGIMTVPTRAVALGRFGVGVELNSDYFRDGLGYLQQADDQAGAPTLFDFIGENDGEDDVDGEQMRIG